ncbi:MAG: M48 family metallopeptidase [Bdellovibrionota bacterium]
MGASTQNPSSTPASEHPWAKRLKRSRRIVSAAEGACALLLTSILALDLASRWSAQLTENISSIWLRAFFYCGALAIVYGGISFPFSFIRGYIIEKHFGLSTQAISSWLADQVKASLLGIVLGSFVLLGLMASLLWGQALWWLVAASGATLFGILLTRLTPQVILPLFFKLKPIDSHELNQRFKDLAQRTNTPVLGIFEIDLSKRTKAANAAVIGFGATRKAVVGDTLLSEFSADEIEFVLAHELAHHRYHDLWSGIALGSVITLVTLAVTHFAMLKLRLVFQFGFPPQPESFDPVIFFWIAITSTIVGKILSPISKIFSRSIETRADRFAAQATRDPSAGARAFAKLGHQNLAVFNPPGWEEFLFYTHPSIQRRIDTLNNSR